MRLEGETETTKKLYGLDSSDAQTAGYARQCLLARRLVERGVRFVELSCLNEGIGAGMHLIHGISTVPLKKDMPPWLTKWINRSLAYFKT